ncbi:lactonase family protein [Nostoc sp. CHAB 5844]|nr:lactonase family protein [Nostoc sp. CHAB 5844]
MIPVQITRQAKHWLRIICFITGFTAVVLIGAFLSYSAQAYRPSQTSIVYAESNLPTENGNSILGFLRDDNGNLTPLPNSPFPAGGAGIAADPTFTNLRIFSSDQNIIVNPEQTRLFAVNSGSNTIAVFDIERDGSLAPVPGSPFPSGGVNPVSVGLAKNFLFVVNKNRDPQNPAQEASNSLPNYTVFRVTPRGRLIPVPESHKAALFTQYWRYARGSNLIRVPESTVSLPAGSDPTQALVSIDKKLLFGADQFAGVLRSFRILPEGRLLESPNSPLLLPASEFAGTGRPPFPLGLQVHPRLPILYVGFVTINRLGVYTFNPSTGALSFFKTVPNSGQAPCWIITNRAGTRLYTTNSVDNSVTVYNLVNPITPVQIQRVVLKGVGSAVQLALDETESFLQVVDRRNSPNRVEGNGLHILKVNQDGTLNEVDSSPIPLPSVENSFSQGIAVVTSRK